MPKLKYLRDVATLQLNAESCTGCGMCITVCPHAVFAVNAGKAAILDRDACIECGACALNCPADAIEVCKGVGCATAVIRGTLGKSGEYCCD